MDPSPIPKFGDPKMSDCPALQLSGAGRERRIRAIAPHTVVGGLDFEGRPFERGGPRANARSAAMRRAISTRW